MNSDQPNHESNSISRVKTIKQKLKKPSRKQLILGALVVILLSWSGGLLYLRFMTSSYKADMDEVRASLQSESSTIASLTTPDKIERGQIDSALGYIVEKSEEIAQQSPPNLPSSRQLKLLRPLDSSWRQNVSSLDKVSTIQAEKERLMSHHATVLKTVRTIMSYNPEADLSGDELADTEITSRIKAAKEGLVVMSKDIAQLQAYSPNDDIKELQATIQNLQKDLNEFDQTRNKDAWYQAVAKAQTNIINNRQAFWEKQSNELLSDYALVIQDISTIINKL